MLRLLALSFASAVVLCARPAAADLLTPITDGRYVFVDHCPEQGPCLSDTGRPANSFAPFHDEAAVGDTHASQHTSASFAADQSSLAGSLAAGTAPEPPLGNTLGDAVFDITFDADAAAYYAWTGAGTISGGGYGGAFLYDLTSDTILFETSLPASFDRSGGLTAGHRYQIFLHATSLGQGAADWEFDFTVIPEPALAASLASGAAVLALLARRRGVA